MWAPGEFLVSIARGGLQLDGKEVDWLTLCLSAHPSATPNWDLPGIKSRSSLFPRRLPSRSRHEWETPTHGASQRASRTWTSSSAMRPSMPPATPSRYALVSMVIKQPTSHLSWHSNSIRCVMVWWRTGTWWSAFWSSASLSICAPSLRITTSCWLSRR